MTTLADIHALVLAGRANAPHEHDLRYYADADRLLQSEPLECVHPEFGPGILVGVNRDGFGLFHPDTSDHPLEVDVFSLREAIR